MKGPRSNVLLRSMGLAIGSVWRGALGRVVVVGITGSSGKTTAKRLIAAVLAPQGPGVVSRESRNAAGEVVRTLLRARPWHHHVVQEVGASRPGSIADVARALRPDVAVVLNVGRDHASAFRTGDAVAAEKGCLVEQARPDGWAILNADDPLVRAMAARARGRVLTFGCSAEAEVRGEEIGAAWPDRLRLRLTRGAEMVSVQTRLCGDAWVGAVLAAAAVGVAMGMPLAEIARRLGGVEPEPGRMSPVPVGRGVVFLRDDWKSPTWTLPALFRFVAAARAQRRILVLGSLSDDATRPRRLYARVAAEAARAADEVVLVGPWSAHGLHGTAGGEGRIRAFTTAQEADRYLGQHLQPGDLVVVRASSTTDHLERLVMNRQQPIACWRERCGVRVYCDACAKLRQPPISDMTRSVG